jgi:Nucleoside 2-deoxyribosyltransferase/pfkB family carbohydrate kinase
MKALHIAGGTYREICRFPEHRSIFGSGGRAAAAVSTMNPQVSLHTFVPSALQAEVTTQFDAFDFSTDFHSSPQLIAFRYLHGLATPVAEPPLSLVAGNLQMTIVEDCVLRYGMVEGEAVVHADCAVYDPQAPLDAKRFSVNGSTAKRLAYVVNSSEARLLTGEEDASAQIAWIHSNEGADAVVLKQGPYGATVSEGGTLTQVPCFKTDHVWPIGSGDVFSAVFAQFWACQGQTAGDAAMKASLATAYYCEASSVPVPASALTMQRDALKPKGPGKPRIYLAGPFFTLAQRWLIDDLFETMQGLGAEVFSPVHHVGEGKPEVVAPADLAGIDASQVLLAVLDGLDAGTLVEVGYAIAKGVPVISFTQTEQDSDLTMLIGTGCVVERDLVTAVYKAMWTALER